ncbi:MAG: hypothetical protein OXB94_13485 [Nitrospira sp.]|nr:hypothetical protein [Nitrospira sp.]
MRNQQPTIALFLDGLSRQLLPEERIRYINATLEIEATKLDIIQLRIEQLALKRQLNLLKQEGVWEEQ